MAVLLGSCIAFWVLYAIIAYFTKHEIGLWIAGVLGLIGGFGALAGRGDYNTLIASAISIIAILLIEKIQINSPEKLKEKRLAEKENNISSTRVINENTTIFDNNDSEMSKYLTEEEKQELFKRKKIYFNPETGLKKLKDKFKEIPLIDLEKKKKLEKMFYRSFKDVVKIEDIMINGKKSKLYYFKPVAFTQIGQFYYLLEIGVRNPQYFALEFSYDCSFFVTEWEFTEDGYEKCHRTYNALAEGIDDSFTQDDYIEEVKKILKIRKKENG